MSPPSGTGVAAATRAPDPLLAHLVVHHWTGRWELGKQSHTTELLSDPSAHFVFERGGPQPSSRLVGVWTKLWRRTLSGRGLVRGVKLQPGALGAFVVTPAHHFTNRITPLARVFPDERFEQLEADVLDARDDCEAIGALEAWLVRRLGTETEAMALAQRLVRRIAEDSTLTSAEALAATEQLSLRALQRLFRQYVGASPKWAIRRHRLQEVALRIASGEGLGMLAHLAAELGYTDQAHLSHDFKEATGKTPGQFARTLGTVSNRRSPGS